MGRWIRSHLTYANAMATLAVFLVLGGGTAAALSGSNTVQSDDIGPGAQVKAADIAASALAAPAWRVIGSAGQPPFNETGSCKWGNFDSVHSIAAFTRDAAGFVHLRGTVIAGVNVKAGGDVVAGDKTTTGGCKAFINSDPTNPMIFQLPPGYRPARREVMAILTGASLGPAASDPAKTGTLAIDGPAISPLPDGAVSVDRQQLGGSPYFTLDGISFRCEPSGKNGCP